VGKGISGESQEGHGDGYIKHFFLQFVLKIVFNYHFPNIFFI
jgi:hypothetical protein